MVISADRQQAESCCALFGSGVSAAASCAPSPVRNITNTMAPYPATPTPAIRRAASAAVAQSSSGTSMSRPEDEEVRPYIIVGDLGKGSFATVYKGYHEVSVCIEVSFSG